MEIVLIITVLTLTPALAIIITTIILVQAAPIGEVLAVAILLAEDTMTVALLQLLWEGRLLDRWSVGSLALLFSLLSLLAVLKRADSNTHSRWVWLLMKLEEQVEVP